jgi:hypothetical protein
LKSKAFALALLFSGAFVAFGALPPVTCPAGGPIGNVDLRVVTPGKSQALPLRTINRLTEGDTVVYSPILRSGEKRTGEVSLVLSPAVPVSKGENVVVLEPKPAGKRAEWKITRKIDVVVFVYGPDGLNQGKVQTFLTKDTDLVAQLADYAEKTNQAEALIQALTATDNSPVAVDAALQGFASQYGISSKIDKTQPADQQAMVMFRTLNPALESSDPLAPGPYQRVGQTATLATSMAGLFFGSPVGLAAGGTAMVMDLKMLAFPRTDFRSSLAEKMPNDGLALCGKKTPPPPHTKIAYLWASRIPNTAPPTITIGNANFIPASQKSPVAVQVADADWKYIDRVRDWRLISADSKQIPVAVSPSGEAAGNQGKALELDLSKVKVAPGAYRLSGDWDWDNFATNGEIHVQQLGDFAVARVAPVAQDQLIAGKGKVQAAITGTDFQFVTGVQFQKINDEFSKPAPIPYVLPGGLRRGPQSQLDILLDTKELDPGQYQFLLTQVDGKAHPVRFDILPPPPSISNLPVVISRSDRIRQFTLKGEHLDRLTKLQSPGGSLALGTAIPDQSERTTTFEAAGDLKPGSAFDIQSFIAGHTEPVLLKNAIHVVGPRPVIESAKLSPPSEISIPLQPGEVAAGAYLSGMLQVKNLEPSSGVQLSCEGQDGNVATLRMGEHSSSATLQLLGTDQAFLSFDTGRWPAGCTIQARMDNGPDGLSDPCRLGRLVRFPHVDTFQVVSAENDGGTYVAELTGTDLQNIEKIGWDATNGIAVADLPAPVPGGGMKQLLKVKLPGMEPGPHAPLYLWLRGDQQGRATTIHD